MPENRRITMCQIIMYLGQDEMKNVIISVRTLALAKIYTLVGCENNCFEGQIVKT